ncbi:GrlR family regulatory protein [Neorhizobium sp. T7_12]|uniref:GrlR family regulatory protein n=1 Tax=Neorhizobium sp. T7_12 TaxID=2093832 RepID=UPI000CF8C135|nr:GrlR family regulatory protein [Neorhizobium sp. T7_12]
MRNGLYKVQFQTPNDIGYGVVFAQDGKMWGGDSAIYYVGSYSLDGDTLTATVKTDVHSKYPGSGSVFGKDQVTIQITGTVNGDTINARGSSPQAPGIGFNATMTRLAD